MVRLSSVLQRNGMLYLAVGNIGNMSNKFGRLDWSYLSWPILNFPLGVRPGLEIYIQGVDIANFEARMQAMTKRTYTAIAQYAKNEKPALVFVPTRKHVRLTAMDLITYSNAGTGEKSFLLRSTEELEPFLNKISDKMLKVTLREGVGYLHEGLNNLDHDIVAQLFEAGWIQCVAIEDDIHLSPLNLGRISSYYHISYTTIERFSSSITSNTKTKGLLEVLSSALEYAYLPIRLGEEEVVCKLINHQRFSFVNPNVKDPHVKANALLQAHFSRQFVGGDMALEQREVLLSANKLLQAMVDVISSNGWLSLALLAMEVSQMLTQGMWERDSMLLQLPHFTKELARKCKENPGMSIETVFDLLEMEDIKRRELLSMSDSQFLDIARFCNRFPNIDLSYEVLQNDSIRVGEDITVHVTLERDLEGRTK
ncbi:hypothetical protein RYX36_011594 [Vicia faba]